MRILGVLALAVVAVLPAARAQGENKGSAAVRWSELDAAWQATKDEEKPLLLYVTMESCHFCTRMEQQTYANPGVISAVNQDFVASRLQRTARPDLIKKLGITTFPTTVIISPQREVLGVMTGYVPPDQMMARLEAAKAKRLALNQK